MQQTRLEQAQELRRVKERHEQTRKALLALQMQMQEQEQESVPVPEQAPPQGQVPVRLRDLPSCAPPPPIL